MHIIHLIHLSYSSIVGHVSTVYPVKKEKIVSSLLLKSAMKYPILSYVIPIMQSNTICARVIISPQYYYNFLFYTYGKTALPHCK